MRPLNTPTLEPFIAFVLVYDILNGTYYTIIDTAKASKAQSLFSNTFLTKNEIAEIKHNINECNLKVKLEICILIVVQCLHD